MANEHTPHSFFWDSKLPKERQLEINMWIESLTEEQRKMLDDLMRDVREEEQFNSEED